MFETNSSSVHALTMATQSEYDRFRDGTMLIDVDNNRLVEISDVDDGKRDSRFLLTYDQWMEQVCGDDEFFFESQTVGGVDVVAFGYFGWN